MSRKTVSNKNKSASVSLRADQIKFLDEHPHFNLSKYVQMILDDYIQLSKTIEKVVKGG